MSVESEEVGRDLSRGVPIWVFGMYRYPILMQPKKPITDSRSDICINIFKYTKMYNYLPYVQQYVHVFIAILYLWWYTA